NIKDDSLYAAEALIRWKHSKNGMILPVDFIPLAIESGMIEDIGWWTLDRVCQHISQWKKDGSWNLEYVSINIDARQLLKNDFATTFMSKLSEHGVDNKDITMEITETSLIDNFTLTIDVLKELHSSGIRCAIDDFGVGYSSLSYLKKLSFNILKIDKEFIKDLTYNKKNIILIKSIIEIGKQFNYSIVIEGIEDEKQKKIIKDIDNSLSYQGHLVSPAISELEFRSKYLS
ncbi:MAG TPA: EAL domain-containing protein, partial [Sulfurovum sp.]|nr:EAL domain-containing protein [Sulfurovum sp.]